MAQRVDVYLVRKWDGDLVKHDKFGDVEFQVLVNATRELTVLLNAPDGIGHSLYSADFIFEHDGAEFRVWKKGDKYFTKREIEGMHFFFRGVFAGMHATVQLNREGSL